MKDNLHEILCSIQGEGSLVGTKHVFIRLVGCNLRCSYCDTRESFKSNVFCQVYPYVGKSDGVKLINNPVSSEKVVKLIQDFKAPWLSFTGGEPLLKVDYINEIISKLSRDNYKIMLETNGTLPKQLKKIINDVDYISMDIKLPSLVGADFFGQHEEFLNIAVQKPCYIKIVVTPNFKREEFNKALFLIRQIDPNIPLFIQPVTPKKDAKGIDIFEVISLQTDALEIINDVRILPQIHPWLGLN